MHELGWLRPESASTAEHEIDARLPTARRLIDIVVEAADLDRDRILVDDVLSRVTMLLFETDLTVTVSDRSTFETHLEKTDRDVVELGGTGVDGVAWHTPSVEGPIVAATFANEEAAAVSMVQRAAMARVYQPLLSRTG